MGMRAGGRVFKTDAAMKKYYEKQIAELQETIELLQSDIPILTHREWVQATMNKLNFHGLQEVQRIVKYIYDRSKSAR